MGRMLANIAGMARILDAETVVMGMQPSVAITLVELGLSLPGIRTALNVDRGMDCCALPGIGGPSPWQSRNPMNWGCRQNDNICWSDRPFAARP